MSEITLNAVDNEVLQVSNIKGTVSNIVVLKIIGKPSRVVFNSCEYVELQSFLIKGVCTKAINQKRGLIEIIACHHLDFVDVSIFGQPHDTTKRAWEESVPNGLIIHEDTEHIRLQRLRVSYCHLGVACRGQHVLINDALVSRCSGDHLQITNDHIKVANSHFLWSIEVLDYERWHRDFIQIFPASSASNNMAGHAVIDDIEISDCHFDSSASADVHKWAAAVQNILLSDGVGKNIKIKNNKIRTGNVIAVLLNPCFNSNIENNEVSCSADIVPILGIEDRKKYGISGRDNCINNNKIIITNAVKHEGNGMPNYKVGCAFTDQVESLRNKSAKRLTDDDYVAAADRLRVSNAMIKAVAKVESRGFGFNSNGSVKSLLERHWVYKHCVKRGINVKDAQRRLGKNIINKRAGGYKGDIAEYQRAKEASRVDETQGLDIALMSCSWGEFQIMGFNYHLVGYESSLEMVTAFHELESKHLDAFCAFLENTGLVSYLRAAEDAIKAGKSPRFALKKFADGYNGKNHNNYDAKIAAEYRKLSDMPVDFKSMKKSRTIRGATGSIIGKTVSVGGLLEVQNMLKEIKETKQQVIETKEQMMAIATDMKTEISDEMASSQWLLWLIIGVLVVSKLGDLQVLWARFTDRWAGYH